MTQEASPALASVLAAPDYTSDPFDLAAAFAEQRVAFRLAGCGADAPADIGAHVRRSFLGALGAGASPEAAAGGVCPWDPPCALDVFCREQMRGPRGDGLPKPYVVETTRSGDDLIVAIRVFGMAIDWFPAAAEAAMAGLRTIMPWARLLPGRAAMPDIISREINMSRVSPPAPAP